MTTIKTFGIGFVSIVGVLATIIFLCWGLGWVADRVFDAKIRSADGGPPTFSDYVFTGYLMVILLFGVGLTSMMVGKSVRRVFDRKEQQ